MTARTLAKFRHKSGATCSVVGVGATLGAAWIDACDKAARVLCPKSATPGYDMRVVAHRVSEAGR